MDRPELDALPSTSPPPESVQPAAAQPVGCPSCGSTIVWLQRNKLRVRVASKYLFVRLPSGTVEVTCERCGTDVDLWRVDLDSKNSPKDEIAEVDCP